MDIFNCVALKWLDSVYYCRHQAVQRRFEKRKVNIKNIYLFQSKSSQSKHNAGAAASGT